MRVKLCVSVVAVIAWSVSPAMAAQSTLVDSSVARPARDPNQKICEDITYVGSRLATKRICATRAEWEARKKASRDEVDDIQRSPCVRIPGNNCK